MFIIACMRSRSASGHSFSDFDDFENEKEAMTTTTLMIEGERGGGHHHHLRKEMNRYPSSNECY